MITMSGIDEIQKQLLENIIVIGGTSHAYNFRERLQFELSKCLQEEKIIDLDVKIR